MSVIKRNLLLTLKKKYITHLSTHKTQTNTGPYSEPGRVSGWFRFVCIYIYYKFKKKKYIYNSDMR